MERACFLFGHADTATSVLPKLQQAIEGEVLNGVKTFYVGSRGKFDQIAVTALKTIKQKRKEIRIFLLLAYHPSERKAEIPLEFDGTFYPPIETIPRQYAIVQANQYMIKNVESVICCVHHVGNTRALLELALKEATKRKLRITNVAII